MLEYTCCVGDFSNISDRYISLSALEYRSITVAMRQFWWRSFNHDCGLVAPLEFVHFSSCFVWTHYEPEESMKYTEHILSFEGFGCINFYGCLAVWSCETSGVRPLLLLVCLNPLGLGSLCVVEIFLSQLQVLGLCLAYADPMASLSTGHYSKLL